ncbi:MAG TPA: hypothetical protein VGM53_27095 [Streptosporangiaceae bacterium]
MLDHWLRTQGLHGQVQRAGVVAPWPRQGQHAALVKFGRPLAVCGTCRQPPGVAGEGEFDTDHDAGPGPSPSSILPGSPPPGSGPPTPDGPWPHVGGFLTESSSWPVGRRAAPYGVLMASVPQGVLRRMQDAASRMWPAGCRWTAGSVPRHRRRGLAGALCLHAARLVHAAGGRELVIHPAAMPPTRHPGVPTGDAASPTQAAP